MSTFVGCLGIDVEASDSASFVFVFSGTGFVLGMTIIGVDLTLSNGDVIAGHNSLSFSYSFGDSNSMFLWW